MAKEYGFNSGAQYYAFVYGMSSDDYQSMLQKEAEFDAKYTLVLDEIVTVEKLADSYPEYSKEELRDAAEQLVIDSADIDGSLN